MAKKKRSNIKKKKSAGVWIVLTMVLALTNMGTLGYFLLYQDLVPAEDVPLNIGDVAANSEDYQNQTLTISGYYIIAADHHMLVSNPNFYFNNSLGSGNHVILLGEIPSSMREFLGKICKVKGELEVEDDSDGTLGLRYHSYLGMESEIVAAGSFEDLQMYPYDKFNLIPAIHDIVGTKYAVLYSGGIRPGKDYYRYWNDIVYMKFVLEMHGFQEDNIYIIYKDGFGEDLVTPSNYPAVHSSLDTVFGILSAEMDIRDSLFFFTTNHGGNGGISVWEPKDSSGALTHTQVATWLDSIACHHMVILMEQCVSGKFIPYLSAENRIIITACSDGESSYMCDDEGNWDEFVYHFMCALVEFAWNDDPITINSDLDNNGYISMREAFIWAALADSRAETPLYDDDGDGVGENVFETIYLPGPYYGDAIYL